MCTTDRPAPSSDGAPRQDHEHKLGLDTKTDPSRNVALRLRMRQTQNCHVSVSAQSRGWLSSHAECDAHFMTRHVRTALRHLTFTASHTDSGIRGFIRSFEIVR